MPENLFPKQMVLIGLYITASESSNWILRFIMEAETSNYSLINVNATYFTSTPTVRRHAEACLSTTYTKFHPHNTPERGSS